MMKFNTNKPALNNRDRAKIFDRNAGRWNYFSHMPLVGGYCSRKAEINRLAADLFHNEMEVAMAGMYLSNRDFLKILKSTQTQIRDSESVEQKDSTSPKLDETNPIQAIEYRRAKLALKALDEAIEDRDQAYEKMIEQIDKIEKTDFGPKKKERKIAKIREEYEVIGIVFRNLVREFAELRKIVKEYEEKNGGGEFQKP